MSSALWVQVALVVCYLRYSIVAVITIHKDLSSPVFLALTYAGLFTVINSSLNPLLYCWENRNVRHQWWIPLVNSAFHPVKLFSPLEGGELKGALDRGGLNV